MIDLHSHVLPGLDDGAADIEVSLRMLSIAASDGITSIAATPHYIVGHFAPTSAEVLASADELRRSIEKAGLGIELTTAHEVRATPGIPKKVENGEVLTFDKSKRYLLLELPGGQVLDWIDQLVFELQIAEITPIIAHPERQSAVIKNPDFLYELILKGCLAQVTAGSLTGRWGERIRETSEILLKNNMIHLISSDAHDDIDRIPMLSSAREVVSALAGPRAAEVLFEENPRKILDGIEFSGPDPIKPEKPEPPGLFDSFRKIFK